MKKLLLGTGMGVGMAALGALAGAKLVGHRVHSRHGRPMETIDADDGAVHHRVTVRDGANIHVVEVGPTDAPVVVLMHGVTLQWWVWSDVIAGLATDHRVLAWDMRGHGSSTIGSDGVGFEIIANDLEDVLSHFDLRGVTVVGHSMGGMVLGEFVAHRSEIVAQRVAAGVWVATSAAPASHNLIRGGAAAAVGLTAALAKRMAAWRPTPRVLPTGDITAAALSLAFGPDVTAEMVDALRVMESETEPEAMSLAADALVTFDVRRALSDATAVRALPATVVVGTHDRLTPPVHARDLAARLAGSELVILDRVGHQVMQERPQALVDIIGGHTHG